MHTQDFFTASNIRIRHNNLAIKATWAQQGWIQHIGAVGGCDKDHAFIGFETIHFNQQLIKRLLAFIIAAANARPGDGMSRAECNTSPGACLGRF